MAGRLSGGVSPLTAEAGLAPSSSSSSSARLQRPWAPPHPLPPRKMAPAARPDAAGGSRSFLPGRAGPGRTPPTPRPTKAPGGGVGCGRALRHRQGALGGAPRRAPLPPRAAKWTRSAPRARTRRGPYHRASGGGGGRGALRGWNVPPQSGGGREGTFHGTDAGGIWGGGIPPPHGAAPRGTGARRGAAGRLPGLWGGGGGAPRGSLTMAAAAGGGARCGGGCSPRRLGAARAPAAGREAARARAGRKRCRRHGRRARRRKRLLWWEPRVATPRCLTRDRAHARLPPPRSVHPLRGAGRPIGGGAGG